MIVRTKNNLADSSQNTYFSYPEVGGTNVIRWDNPSSAAASWALQLGAIGNENTEVVLLSSSTPAGTAGTLTANTLYPHPTDTPIFFIKYNQIVFERSTAGTAGTATPMTDGTVTIQADSTITQFDDTTGSTSYAYRTYFRNSVLAVNSAESDWITPAGFSFYSLAKIRSRIRSRFSNSDYLQDGDIDNSINEWLQMMNNGAVDVNENYAMGTTSIAYAANTELGTVTATDFRGGVNRAWLVDNAGTYEMTKMDLNQLGPNDLFTSQAASYYMQGDAVIGRKPIDTAGTMFIAYYKQTPILVNDTDELPIPMQPFTKSFIDYGQAMGLHKDNKHNEAQGFETSAASQLGMFKTQISPRNTSGNDYVRIVEDY